MEEEKYSLSRQASKSAADHRFGGLIVQESARHVPPKTYIEPKVYTPYKSRPGQVPRPIEVERKRRKYSSIDITEMFQENGVLQRLRQHFVDLKKGDVLSMPLTLYDNTDLQSHPLTSWKRFIETAKEDGGLPARAMLIRNPLDSPDDFLID